MAACSAVAEDICPVTFGIEDDEKYIYVVLTNKHCDCEDSGTGLCMRNHQEMSKTRHWIPPPARTSKCASKQKCHPRFLKFECNYKPEVCINGCSINLDDESSEFSVKVKEIENEIRNLKEMISSTGELSLREAVRTEESGEFVSTTEVEDKPAFDSSSVDRVYSSTISVTTDVISRIRNLRSFVRNLNPESEEFQSDVKFIEHSKANLLNVMSELESRNTELQEFLGNISDLEGIQEKVHELDFCNEALRREISLLMDSRQVLDDALTVQDAEEVSNVQGSSTSKRQSFRGSRSITVRNGNLTNIPATAEKSDEKDAYIKMLQQRLDESVSKIEDLQFTSKQAAETSNMEKEKLLQAILIQQHRMEEENIRLNDSLGALNLQIAKLNGEKERLEIENHTLEVRLYDLDVDKEAADLESASGKLSEAVIELRSVEEENRNLMGLVENMKAELERTKLETKSNEIENKSSYLVDEQKVEDSKLAQGAMRRSQMYINPARLAVHKQTQTTETYSTSCTASPTKRSEVKIGDEQLEQIIVHHVKNQEDLNMIIEKLQEFEEKFERSRAINEELSSEVQRKETEMMEIAARYEATVAENARLEQKLGKSTKELRSFSSEAKSAAFVLEREMQLKMSELEQFIKSLQHENKVLRQENVKIEKKHAYEIAGIQRRFEEQQVSNRRLQEYISFLRSSYAEMVDKPVVQGLN